MHQVRQHFTILFFLVLLGGCAATQEAGKDYVPEVDEVDPYEGFNRGMYKFNNTVDDYVAEPIANAYKWITPDFVETGVSNFFTNLGNVTVVVNDVLQGKFKQGAEDTGRFAINSTVGLFGLFDVAKHVGLEQNEEDFDQTLAVWGVPAGPYLVLPFLGPTTFRGVPGTAVDMATNPVTYSGIGLQAAAVVNTRANAEGALKFIDEAALDPYIFTRESYLQWRKHLASDGKDDEAYDVMADLEEEFYDEDDEVDESEPGGEVEKADKKPGSLSEAYLDSLNGNQAEEGDELTEEGLGGERPAPDENNQY